MLPGKGACAMEQQTMGARIAALRKEKGMTQLELAQRMNVTDKAVSKWERGRCAPDIHSLPRLAQALGTTSAALLEAAPPQEKSGEARRILRLVLRAVPLAMGVAAAVLGILKEIDLPTAATLLGLGLACLGVYLLDRDGEG